MLRATTLDVGLVSSDKNFKPSKQVLFTKDTIREAIKELRQAPGADYIVPLSTKSAKKSELAFELCSLRSQLFIKFPEKKVELEEAASLRVQQPTGFNTERRRRSCVEASLFRTSDRQPET